jgi:hypothetical protein
VLPSDVVDLTLTAGDLPQLRPTNGTRPAPASTRLPYRAQEFLPCLEAQPCAAEAVAADLLTPPFVAGFARPYSYEDVPIRGLPVEGFGPIQLNVDSWRWTTSPDAALFARLDRGRYQIRVQVLRSFAPEAAALATLSLNGVDLVTRPELDERGGTTLTAVATVGTGSPVADRIGIHSSVKKVPSEPDLLWGLAVESVSVKPWGR